MAGRHEDAARLLGWTRHYFATNAEAVLMPAAAQKRAESEALLGQHIPARMIEDLSREGAALSESDACQLALRA